MTLHAQTQYHKKRKEIILSVSESWVCLCFRIIAMCGDYYIGGRRFSSLSDLIGYYSYVSCLLKGEKLLSPVAPPEVMLPSQLAVTVLQEMSCSYITAETLKKKILFAIISVYLTVSVYDKAASCSTACSMKIYFYRHFSPLVISSESEDLPVTHEGLVFQ